MFINDPLNKNLFYTKTNDTPGNFAHVDKTYEQASSVFEAQHTNDPFATKVDGNQILEQYSLDNGWEDVQVPFENGQYSYNVNGISFKLADKEGVTVRKNQETGEVFILGLNDENTSITLEPGAKITVYNSTFDSIKTTTPNDAQPVGCEMYISGCDVKGSIEGSDYSDKITVIGSRANKSTADSYIDSKDGNDIIEILNSDCGYVAAGEGDDEINIDSSYIDLVEGLAGDDDIYVKNSSGGYISGYYESFEYLNSDYDYGNDEIYIEDSVFSKVSTSYGKDKITLVNSFADEICDERGDSEITLDNSYANTVGNRSETRSEVIIKNSSDVRDLYVRGTDSFNTVIVEDSSVVAKIDADSGDDSIVVSDNSYVNDLYIGAGADHVLVEEKSGIYRVSYDVEQLRPDDKPDQIKVADEYSYITNQEVPSEVYVADLSGFSSSDMGIIEQYSSNEWFDIEPVKTYGNEYIFTTRNGTEIIVDNIDSALVRQNARTGEIFVIGLEGSISSSTSTEMAIYNSTLGSIGATGKENEFYVHNSTITGYVDLMGEESNILEVRDSKIADIYVQSETGTVNVYDSSEVGSVEVCADSGYINLCDSFAGNLRGNGKVNYIHASGQRAVIGTVFVGSGVGYVNLDDNASTSTITTSGGDDIITVDSARVDGIFTNGGNDIVSVKNTSGLNQDFTKVDTSKGDDYVYVDNTNRSNRNVEIATGNGKDTVRVVPLENGEDSYVSFVDFDNKKDVKEIETLQTTEGTVEKNGVEVSESTAAIIEVSQASDFDEMTIADIAFSVTDSLVDKYIDSNIEITEETYNYLYALDQLTTDFAVYADGFYEVERIGGNVSGFYNFLKEITGFGISDTDIRGAIDTQEQMLFELQEAINGRSSETFEETFERWTGVEYNPELINQYIQNKNMLASSSQVIYEEEAFAESLDKARSLDEYYAVYEARYGEEAAMRFNEDMQAIYEAEGSIVNPMVFYDDKSKKFYLSTFTYPTAHLDPMPELDKNHQNGLNQLIREFGTENQFFSGDFDTSCYIMDKFRQTDLVGNVREKLVGEAHQQIKENTGKSYEEWANLCAVSQLDAYGMRGNPFQELINVYCEDQQTYLDRMSMIGSGVGVALMLVGGVLVYVPGAQVAGAGLMKAGMVTSIVSQQTDNILETFDAYTSNMTPTEKEQVLRECIKESLIEISTQLAGMGAGYLGNLAGKGVIALLGNPAGQNLFKKGLTLLTKFVADHGVDAGMSLLTDLALTGEVNLDSELFSQFVGIVTGHAQIELGRFYKSQATDMVAYARQNNLPVTDAMLKEYGISRSWARRNIPEYDSSKTRTQDSVAGTEDNTGTGQKGTDVPNAPKAQAPDINAPRDYEAIRQNNQSVLEGFGLKPEEAQLYAGLKDCEFKRDANGALTLNGKQVSVKEVRVGKNASKNVLTLGKCELEVENDTLMLGGQKVTVDDNNIRLGDYDLTLSADGTQLKLGNYELSANSKGITIGGQKVTFDGNGFKLGEYNLEFNSSNGILKFAGYELGTNANGDLTLGGCKLGVQGSDITLCGQKITMNNNVLMLGQCPLSLENGILKFGGHKLNAVNGKLMVEYNGKNYPIEATNKKILINGADLTKCSNPQIFNEALECLFKNISDAEELLARLKGPASDNLTRAQRMLLERYKKITDIQVYGGDIMALNRLGKYFEGFKPEQIEIRDNGFSVTRTDANGDVFSGEYTFDGTVCTKRVIINGEQVGNTVKIEGENIYILDANGQVLSKYEGSGKLVTYSVMDETGELHPFGVQDVESELVPIKRAEGNLELKMETILPTDSVEMPELPLKVGDSIPEPQAGQKNVDALISALNNDTTLLRPTDDMVLCIVADGQGNIISMGRNGLPSTENTGIMDIVRPLYMPNENRYDFNCAEMSALDNQSVVSAITQGQSSELVMYSIQYDTKKGIWKIDPNCSSCFQVRNLFGIQDGTVYQSN